MQQLKRRAKRHRQKVARSKGEEPHCFYCGVMTHQGGPSDPSGTKRTRDHIIPQSRGGMDTVTACRQCNQDKGQLTLEEYRVVCAYRDGKLNKLSEYKFYGEDCS